MPKSKNANKLSLTETTYHFLREKIMSNEYPPGTPIIESVIVGQLKVSRTPVREAIQRLEQEKLVQIFPKRGAFVTQIAVTSIKDIFEIREIIEPIVTLSVTKNMTQTTVDEINDIEKKLLKIKKDDPIDGENARKVGRELDDAIIEAFGNQTLIEFMKSLRSHMDRGCALVGRTDNNVGVLLEQHLRIIESIKEREAGKAEKLMKDHLSYAKESLLLS